ncbi:glycosyltransferase family A protein [Williamsia sp.]|uniref:glycosyltransferase family A protein n=1 Tax=Williamsia sp. TaxID=1872085 RepID=UPI001A20D295|nr:glycosyltransferase family A protein [Williamsia sp.]MBJ7288815.1 glycosyltransferase family 2 protein [Williamsia sp.]
MSDLAPRSGPMNLWIVVPAYNEAAMLPATLAALLCQTDQDFSLIVVDNGSHDQTPIIAKQFASTASFPVTVLTEHGKGVGAAVDTGFRHAIATGATHIARTDADCLPRTDWIAEIRRAFGGDAELVCGHLVARSDENGAIARIMFRVMVIAAAYFGRLRPANRGPEYLVPYQMHAGNNMAITADLYVRCGGMPRLPSPTDRTFLNRVRRTTGRIEHRRTMVSENSTRRIRAYGLLGTARWYLDRGPGRRSPDPR